MFNKNKKINKLELRICKLEVDAYDRDREMNRLNSDIKEMSEHYSDRYSKPHVQADMATNIQLDTPELVIPINELKKVSNGTPHIRIDIPAINDYPRVYIDGEVLAGSTDRAIQKLLLKYDTGNATINPSQNIDVQYIEKDANHWSVKKYKESTLDYEDDPNSNSKIHELPEREQPKSIHVNNSIESYYASIEDPNSIALLSKPNTRLAIIEEDE